MRLLSTMLLSAALFAAVAFQPAVVAEKSISGAWGYGPPENKTVLIAAGNVFSVAEYDVPGKRLINSYGGTWRMDNNKLIKTIEWNAADSTQVGTKLVEEVELQGDKLRMKGNKETWTRLDDGTPGALAGAWIITGSYMNDTAAKRPSPFYPRRAMKVLSGKYFHWIAYNVATKAFLNAGGGTYTTVNGTYTENIEFFTKTAASVGKTLQFEYAFVNGDWRHKGQKSTGGALDECWSKRETLEK